MRIENDYNIGYCDYETEQFITFNLKAYNKIQVRLFAIQNLKEKHYVENFIDRGLQIRRIYKNN